MLGRGTPAFVGSINISDSDDEMPKVIRSNSTNHDSKEVRSGKEELPQTKEQIMPLYQRSAEDKLKSKQETLGCANAEDTVKRKEASSSRSPVFWKRFKGGTNAEDNYSIFDSDDSSSGSENEGSEDLSLEIIFSELAKASNRDTTPRYNHLTNKAMSLLFFFSCITFIAYRDPLDIQFIHSDITELAVSLFGYFMVLSPSISFLLSANILQWGCFSFPSFVQLLIVKNNV